MPDAIPPITPLNDALFTRVKDAIEALRRGDTIVLVDEQEQLTEGALLTAADHISPEAINFMATEARGLVALALCPEQVERLALPMMQRARDRAAKSAFTVSIEAAHGVTTGISASDRARTVLAAINPDAETGDVVTPGHVFPLKGRPGGVLVRSGKTEAAIDLARLAGRTPAGVLCDVLAEDGSLADREALARFAAAHQLALVSIADVISYRLHTERLIRRVDELTVELDATESAWRAVVYEASVEGRELVALVKGDVGAAAEPVLCRMHAGSTLADTFVSTPREGGRHLAEAIVAIEAAGVGVVVYLPPRSALRDELSALRRGQDSAKEEAPGTLREYGLGAQVLRDLGLRRIRLLSNSPRQLASIGAYGLDITERVPLVSMSAQ